MQKSPAIKIRRAKECEHECLSDLALRSKSHWGYPIEYLEKCRPALTVSIDDINNWHTFVVESDCKIQGFYMLKTLEKENRLDHLWLEPDVIGNGIGSLLFSDAIMKSKKLGWKSFRIVADPKAQGFYEKVGAIVIGKTQSKISPDIFLTHMEYIMDDMVKLTPPKEEDIDCYHEIFSDPETHHFIIDEGQQDIEGSTKKLNKLIEINGVHKRIYTIINNDSPSGFIVIHYDESKLPFISYAIRRSQWRKGIAANALNAFLKLEQENFDGFNAATHLDNVASQNLLEKIGFESLGEQDLKMGRRNVYKFLYGEANL